MAVYGYARVSTKTQEDSGTSLSDQASCILNKYPAAVMYQESFTGKTTNRPVFSQLLSLLKANDTLVVAKLDRFCRSVTEGLECIKMLQKRGVLIHILNFGLIDNTPTGTLMVTTLLAFAEFERSMIRERMESGKAYKRETDPEWREGRPKKLNDETYREYSGRVARGEATVTECCKQLGISTRTWHRYAASSM